MFSVLIFLSTQERAKAELRMRNRRDTNEYD